MTAAPHVEHHRIAANGQTFYCASAGPEDGPPVLLLHGFPEMSYGWRNQIGPLARAGLRVIAPDQRGYGHSSKPEGLRAYVVEALGDDVVAIGQAFGHPRFAVVGHDWGGIVAWHLGESRPDVVERLAILNAPHLGIFAGYAWRHPAQLLMSSYVAALQLPGVAELALGAADHALLRAALTRTSRAGTFSEEELRVYGEAWSAPGALTAMLNWYRALRLRPKRRPGRVSAPTLILWGDRDAALQPGLAEESAALCDEAEVRHFPNASHWLQHEEVAEVNAALVSFLGRR
jgi:pimeloyl-ACP methyl ester carboxylesterase